LSRPRSLGAGELRVAAAPDRLVIHGLGSCVAVFLYDPESRVGGLAHILLPEPGAGAAPRAGRYATTAITAMIDESLRRGARRAALLAKVTGGSRMFIFESAAARPSIGEKNVEAALRVLKEERVPVVATDTGGESGRTVTADLADGSLTIRTVRGTPRVI
jgi:chemotaxis protein CheD